MRLIPRVDDRPLDHRVEVHERLEEVGPLGQLIRDRGRLIFRPDLPRARVDLAGDEERDEGARNALERDRAGHQVVLMIPDRKSTRLNSSHGYISYAVF